VSEELNVSSFSASQRRIQSGAALFSPGNVPRTRQVHALGEFVLAAPPCARWLAPASRPQLGCQIRVESIVVTTGESGKPGAEAKKGLF
jgi:hypothetical protein